MSCASVAYAKRRGLYTTSTKDGPDLDDSAKDLIAQISAGTPSDDLFDAKVKVMGEYIAHHVKEEESELFPKARKSDLELLALGDELSSRKAELLVELEDRADS